MEESSQSACQTAPGTAIELKCREFQGTKYYAWFANNGLRCCGDFVNLEHSLHALHAGLSGILSAASSEAPTIQVPTKKLVTPSRRAISRLSGN